MDSFQQLIRIRLTQYGGLTQNNFTDALKTKLDSLSNYTLVAASDSTLGGIKVLLIFINFISRLRNSEK